MVVMSLSSGVINTTSNIVCFHFDYTDTQYIIRKAKQYQEVALITVFKQEKKLTLQNEITINNVFHQCNNDTLPCISKKFKRIKS